MKKEYKKPQILIEDFSLIENIAISACATVTHSHYSYNCSYDDPEAGNIFFSAACGFIIEQGEDEGDGFVMDCENGFGNVFSS